MTITNLRSEHKMEQAQQQQWRSGYGDTSEPNGFRTFLLCSCGEWREFQGEFNLAKTEHEAEVERSVRGYDLKGEFFICRFDRTLTDSMDSHDLICPRPKKNS